MSQYTSYDFSETLRITGIEREHVEKVIAAWGNVDSAGACCEACGGEWSGGFLMKLRDGRFAYVSGWCDYTGWGCQDDAEVKHFDERPSFADLDQVEGWDESPEDLRRWVATGSDEEAA